MLLCNEIKEHNFVLKNTKSAQIETFKIGQIVQSTT